MKQIKKDLQTMAKSIKTLSQKTEKILRQIEKLDKPKAKKKAPAKRPPSKKTKTLGPSDAVLAIIKRSKKGVDASTLIKKIGFKENNLRAIIFRLRKKGEIKSKSKGLYVKA